MALELFRLKDLSLMWVPILIIITVIVGMIIDVNTPMVGYAIGGIVVGACLLIMGIFYYERWLFISKWRFTTDTGVDCFFEKGTIPYTKRDVESELSIMLQKWADWLNKEYKCPKDTIMLGAYINDSMCTFVPSKSFIYKEPGMWSRKVYGIAGWNWCIVGQGGGDISNSAFTHEMSHVLYNIYCGKQISENEAHEVFKKVGVL